MDLGPSKLSSFDISRLISFSLYKKGNIITEKQEYTISVWYNEKKDPSTFIAVLTV
jgi:hypothetical protein